MTKLTLNKSTFLAEARKLESYERFLPSLDLKRKQLLLEKSREENILREIEVELAELIEHSAQDLQMLANSEFRLNALVRLSAVHMQEENLLGVVLPKLQRVEFSVHSYGFLSKPHWVDVLARRLQQAGELRLRRDVQHQRVQGLQHAVNKATQRVNLVSRVLIPEAKNNMRRIQIFLADNERAMVVRAKLAKRKKQLPPLRYQEWTP